MKQFLLAAALLLSVLVLAGCGELPAGPMSANPAAETLQVDAPEAGKGPGTATSRGKTLVDQQGAVEVAVTPLNFGQDEATLDFEVAMNTHSVELNMDLSELATLTTDAGVQVKADTWDAPREGHHVSGLLSFPAETDGATTITLILNNVDVPTRTFTWTLK